MAKDDDLLEDIDNEDTDSEVTLEVSTDISKLDARRRLEEYMEMKKLRELTEY